MRRLKLWLFRVLGKDPEAVVVTFRTGDPELCRRMEDEVRALVPDRRHFAVDPLPGGVLRNWLELRRRFRRFRIGLAPVMLGPDHKALRRAACLLAPRKILAYNGRLERHHLRCNLDSLLFRAGVPLDRVRLRPRWWPWPRCDRSVVPAGTRVLEGRPFSGRPRIAVLSPYFPYPLAHGGAVRIFHLLREISRDFDVLLYAFTDSEAPPEAAPVLEFCSRATLARKPRYREPRWSTLLPPEVHEFRSPAMRQALAGGGFDLLQVEYTQLAEYGGDILVEHDVTFDLFGQILRRAPLLSARWDFRRWLRFERAAIRRYPHIVAMSEKDAGLLGESSRVTVIENGVDLERFRPAPEAPGERLLFIGSFRHFPNVLAYRFFVERAWPRLREEFPGMTVTVVAGPDYPVYWRAFCETPAPVPDPRISLHGFVADVRPLYVDANLVLVPTTVSAGTNVKVLEAMAMERAVVSTSSGCAGLGLEHGRDVWVADSPEDFAAGVALMIRDPVRRTALAAAARRRAEECFDWKSLGVKQRDLLRRALKQKGAANATSAPAAPR